MYKKTLDENAIINTETGGTIPRGHRLWSDYEKWLADGNTPEPADVPPVVYSITPSINLVAVNEDVTLNITGGANETVNIDAGAFQIDIVLDENGRGEDVFIPPQGGDYIIKFTDQTLSKVRIKIEAVA